MAYENYKHHYWKSNSWKISFKSFQTIQTKDSPIYLDPIQILITENRHAIVGYVIYINTNYIVRIIFGSMKYVFLIGSAGHCVVPPLINTANSFLFGEIL